MTNDLLEIAKKIARHNGEISAIKEDVSFLKLDQNKMKDEIAEIKETIGGMCGKIDKNTTILLKIILPLLVTIISLIVSLNIIF